MSRRRIDQAPSNPFAAGRDGNFPSFDDAIVVADQSSSICSHSSSMNLSIGARASLQEHLRHVAKYGLDESQVAEPEAPTNPLDQQWEQLVEAASAHNLSNSTASSEIILSSMEAGEESVEVMTDLSVDYFNSSRALLLRTPEKNATRVQSVTLRGGDAFEDASVFSSPHHRSMDDSFRFRDLPHPDCSFADLSAVNTSRLSTLDVSHISADVSEHSPRRPVWQRSSSTPRRRSPSSSHYKENDVNLEGLALSPISSRGGGGGRSLPKGASTRPLDLSLATYFGNLESSAIVEEEDVGSLTSAAHLTDVVYDKSQQSDVSTLRDPSSSAKNTTSSSSTLDRRRYRTVVPVRVFLSDPKDFPESYDSFSAPLPRTTLPVNRSAQSDPLH